MSSRFDSVRRRVWIPVAVGLGVGLAFLAVLWPVGLIAAVPVATRQWLPWASVGASAGATALTVLADDSWAEITISNEMGGTQRKESSRGGHGLRQLGELVADAGGTLQARSVGDLWQLHLTLPLSEGKSR
jgi:hypothetical protein